MDNVTDFRWLSHRKPLRTSLVARCVAGLGLVESRGDLYEPRTGTGTSSWYESRKYRKHDVLIDKMFMSR